MIIFPDLFFAEDSFHFSPFFITIELEDGWEDAELLREADIMDGELSG